MYVDLRGCWGDIQITGCLVLYVPGQDCDAFVDVGMLGVSDKAVPFRRPPLQIERFRYCHEWSKKAIVLVFSFLDCAQMTEFYLSSSGQMESFLPMPATSGERSKGIKSTLDLTEHSGTQVCDLAFYRHAAVETRERSFARNIYTLNEQPHIWRTGLRVIHASASVATTRMSHADSPALLLRMNERFKNRESAVDKED